MGGVLAQSSRTSFRKASRFGRSPLDGVDLAVTVINVPFGDDHS